VRTERSVSIEGFGFAVERRTSRSEVDIMFCVNLVHNTTDITKQAQVVPYKGVQTDWFN
jgi:hypothetical protein